jgi:hypothetical protein
MEQIIIKNKTPEGIVTVEIREDEKSETLSFLPIRCGLNFPSPSGPGFFCLVGQLTRKNISGEYPLRVLREGEEAIPSQLFKTMCDDMGTFGAKEIFTDTGETFKGYVLSFTSFKKEQRRRQPLYLMPAPFTDFSHRVLTIKSMVKKDSLYIPKDSIIYQQLKTITADDLRHQQPGEKFYAISALGFVVSAFEALGSPRGIRSSKQSSAPPIEAFS